MVMAPDMLPKNSTHVRDNPRAFAFAIPLALFGSVAHADVTISSDATENINCSAGVCSPTAASAVLNISDLETLLASGNVEITTTGTGVEANNIDVEAAVAWSGPNALSLDAYQSITISKHIAIAGQSGLSLTTNDGGSGGALLFETNGSVHFKKLSSTLTINSATYTLVGNISTLATAIAANPSGSF